jgi:radical SAM superfamily enzyme YgiQ (UPF0313 family)
MKVLLLNPPSRRPLKSILPPEVEKSRGLFPPLGILYTASAISGLSDIEVEVIDAHAENLGADDIARVVMKGGHNVVGISVLTFTLLDAMDTAVAIKAASPDTFIIAGGPHPHLFPEETLSLGPFNAVMRGEGEISFKEFISNWPGSKDSPPPGISLKGGVKGGPEIAPFIDNLDDLAFPARHLSKIEIYHSVLSGLRPITTMMSSRGCPYKCVFCDRPHLGKKFRARSAKNVVDEMEECASLGIKEVVFYDDTFSVKKERVREIAELLIERNLNMAWDIRARVSDLEKSDYALCKKAGMSRVHFGVESGDPEILQALKKGISVEQAKKAFKSAREAGLETLAYFMVGLPGETRNSLDRTLGLAIELSPDYTHFSMLILFPGTPLYLEGLENEIIKNDVWLDFAKNPTSNFTPPAWEENLTSDEIVDALTIMYKKFYRRPEVLLRRLKGVTSLSGLINGARMGSKILFMKRQKR